MPPTSTMLAHHPRKHATNSTYASTNSTPVIKLLLSICVRVFERLIFNPFFEFFGKEITFPKSIWFSLVTDSREKFLMTIPQVFHQSWQESYRAQYLHLCLFISMSIIKDIPHNLEFLAKLFADDTSPFSIVHSPLLSAEIMNNHLIKISAWVYLWKMHLTQI